MTTDLVPTKTSPWVLMTFFCAGGSGAFASDMRLEDSELALRTSLAARWLTQPEAVVAARTARRVFVNFMGGGSLTRCVSG
ncbi:hypothetical protein D3C71_2124310 [compost metagenome]